MNAVITEVEAAVVPTPVGVNRGKALDCFEFSKSSPRPWG